MIIRQRFTPDTEGLLSWNDLKIGDIYYHTSVETVNMKTSKNGYVSFSDKKYHTRSKLLQGSTSKTYILMKAYLEFELE